jgi:hypothetical protein
MGSLLSLVGQKFNRLLVVKKHHEKSNAGALWVCLCDCGKTAIVNSLKLREGRTKSCGCFRKESISKVNFLHGESNKSTTYKTWKEMRQRCLNPNSDKWQWYGGKGITVCSRWDSYELFLQDMGERPKGMTIDRIDNNKGYSPENCRWLSQLEQTRRQDKNKLKNGVFNLLREDREKLGLTYQELGKKYGVSASAARDCCVKKTWF